MSKREQWIPVVRDPDTGKVVRWRRVETYGSEVEPPSGFAPIEEGGNPDLQNTVRAGSRIGQGQFTNTVDHQAVSKRADAKLGLDEGEAPWWAD